MINIQYISKLPEKKNNLFVKLWMKKGQEFEKQNFALTNPKGQ